MATKKYVMKTEKVSFEDGTDNAEHIRDIISEIEILYNNIQDNNDICMQLYLIKKNIDEDLADALQLACETLVQIEQDAGDIIEVVNKVKENIDKCDKSQEADFKSLLKQMKDFEKKSRKIMEANLS